MKSNVIVAAVIGLVLGVAAELLFAFGGNIPLLSCVIAPVAWLFGLALPVLIGVLAAAWGSRRGLMTTPGGIADGAVAAALAELVSRVIGICASIISAGDSFLGPRFLLPSVGPSARALFSGVWSLGWLVVSIAVAAILGAIGALLYNATTRR